MRHATCEDYRAALEEDLAHDRAEGLKLDCPVLVLWPSGEEVAGRPELAEVWRAWASDVTDVVTSGDHLQPEDRPEEVSAALRPFFSRQLGTLY